MPIEINKRHSTKPTELKEGMPAYRRIQNEIQERIRSGELKSGDPVESERDLARIYRVSLMTARHALKELELEGLVQRRRGSGTFVAPPRIHFNKLVSFTEQMAGRGFTAHSRILSARVIEGETEIAARLALPGTSRLVKLERLRQADSQPFALEVCHLSAEQFPGILESPLDRRSLFTILEEDYGTQLAYADEEVDATAADPRTSELLRVPKAAPLLRIRQVLYSAAGKPTVYSLALYRSDRYSLLTRRFRQSPGRGGNVG